MDHISNYLNFPGIDPQQQKPQDPALPSFYDLPLDTTATQPEQEKKSESTTIDVLELKKRMYAIKDEVLGIIRLLESAPEKLAIPRDIQAPVAVATQTAGGDQIIEGVFTGEKMIGPDGQEYSVPPNYASKSKLVEGDHMKLTITGQG